MRISEVEQVFKDIFEDGVVNSVESVYEKHDDFLKLVISIHGLSIGDISIIHTKFIFKTDLNKREIYEDSFIYLYDINCIYHKITFNSISDLKDKVSDIIGSRDFGDDILILSDFVEAPAMFINYYMRRNKITEYSVFDVKYDPKFKVSSCDKTKFDFKVNINNSYDIEFTVYKIINEDPEQPDLYKFSFKFMDEIETVESDTIKNSHYLIGNSIAKLLDKKLKNK